MAILMSVGIAMTDFQCELANGPSVRSFVGKAGTVESHVVVRAEACADPVATLEENWRQALGQAGIAPESTVFRRVFCRDIGRQHQDLGSLVSTCGGACSLVGQPPVFGEEFALWSYHISRPGEVLVSDGGENYFRLRRGPLQHVWSTGLCRKDEGDTASQTLGIFDDLTQALAADKLTLENDVIRTWWFVRDIDTDYHALVEARKHVFEKHGLTRENHYIASTGIAGAHPHKTAKLSLDTYSIGGLVSGQVEYPSAPDHLGPTYQYGVTFERATSVSYADRKHVFLSGTASIDPSGAIVHPGDVLRQLGRAMGNVEALLAAAGGELSDLAILIVYLRDPWDGAVIEHSLRQTFPWLPMVIVHAPVCRPGWLVEVEGIAWLPAHNPNFPAF